jgi:beta-phosphoglucomutase-like phosphatase (HAD superfamily)
VKEADAVTREERVKAFSQLIDRAGGLIFDFDGFLADSEKFHFKSYKEVFARHGHDVDETEYYKYWTSLGHGARGEIERHTLDLDPIAIRDEKRPIFTRYCEDGSIRLFDEALEMLTLFGSLNKRMAIASGSTSSDIRAILRNAKVGDTFEAILGSDMVPKIKPAPDIFLETLAMMKMAAADCLVFEDAEKGMFAAIEAGIPVVVVLTRETRDFDFSRADFVAESHAELLELLRSTTE